MAKTTLAWLSKEGEGENHGLALLRYHVKGEGRHSTAQNLGFLRGLGFTELNHGYKITVELSDESYEAINLGDNSPGSV